MLEELDRADTEAELEEIRQELQEGGYVRPDGGKKKIRQAKLLPMKFTSTDGYEILVGRNNRQNEFLTFKQARKNDLWLHAQKVHGAHVLILCSNTTPPDDTVTEAAALAAYYSQAKQGQNVGVDVTAAGPGEENGRRKAGHGHLPYLPDRVCESQSRGGEAVNPQTGPKAPGV